MYSVHTYSLVLTIFFRTGVSMSLLISERVLSAGEDLSAWGDICTNIEVTVILYALNEILLSNLINCT